MWRGLGLFAGRSVAPGSGTPLPLQSSVNPTPLDDANDGLLVGQPWVNTTTKVWWVLTDSTPGAAVWVSTSAASPAEVIDESDDFCGSGTGKFNGRTNGTGAGISVSATDAGHDGLLTLSTGTSGIGWAAVGGPASGTITSAMLLGAGPVMFQGIFRVPTLSDGTNTFTVRVGFMRNVSIEPTTAAMLRYTHSVNAGNFEAVTRDADVEVPIDTGVPVVAGSWYHVRIEVNAAATQVLFYVGINGSVPVLVATSTINITLTPLGPACSIVQSAGTTNRTLTVDLMRVRKEYAVSR